jgi:hypothetical protein
MNRSECLDKAKSLINGDRAKDYGDAFDNHERIADGWNLIIKGAMKTHGYITPRHVTLMMDWLKTARLLNNLDSDDGWLDKCGYSAIGMEFCDKEKEIEDSLRSFLGNKKSR